MLAKLKKKYIGDWDFYQKYLLLAIPMILQNAITNLVSFLDNIMVGQLGTEQMSGVAIVNQLIFVYNLAIFGAVSAASIFGAQYFGKGNHKGHMYSFRFKLYATLLVTGGAILLFDQRFRTDLPVSDGYGGEWGYGLGTAVRTGISGHHDGGTDPFCGEPVLRDKYKRDRADLYPDAGQLCGGGY